MSILSIIILMIIITLSICLLSAGYYYGVQKTEKECNEYIYDTYEPNFTYEYPSPLLPQEYNPPDP